MKTCFNIIGVKNSSLTGGDFQKSSTIDTILGSNPKLRKMLEDGLLSTVIIPENNGLMEVSRYLGMQISRKTSIVKIHVFINFLKEFYNKNNRYMKSREARYVGYLKIGYCKDPNYRVRVELKFRDSTDSLVLLYHVENGVIKLVDKGDYWGNRIGERYIQKSERLLGDIVSTLCSLSGVPLYNFIYFVGRETEYIGRGSMYLGYSEASRENSICDEYVQGEYSMMIYENVLA